MESTLGEIFLGYLLDPGSYPGPTDLLVLDSFLTTIAISLNLEHSSSMRLADLAVFF
jgi:hypothetical protein